MTVPGIWQVLNPFWLLLKLGEFYILVLIDPVQSPLCETCSSLSIVTTHGILLGEGNSNLIKCTPVLQQPYEVDVTTPSFHWGRQGLEDEAFSRSHS